MPKRRSQKISDFSLYEFAELFDKLSSEAKSYA